VCQLSLFDSAKNTKDDLRNFISPEVETIAHETLWGITGMSQKKITELYKENILPSKALEFRKRVSDDVDKLYDKVQKYLELKMGLFSICINGDFQYPEELRSAAYPLELFYYKGFLDFVKTRSVSVVGSRSCSPEGLRRTKKITELLVENDFTIVSGLAKGVDTVALNTAIGLKGKVIGVIGTPIDEYYPKENKDLQNFIAKEHLLISQVPFYRYKKEPFSAHRYNFPRRNETMSALSKATVIVEASERSGTLVQARAAIEQGRKLFILNSCFENSKITWPQYYEKKGAIRVREAKDILNNL